MKISEIRAHVIIQRLLLCKDTENGMYLNIPRYFLIPAALSFIDYLEYENTDSFYTKEYFEEMREYIKNSK